MRIEFGFQFEIPVPWGHLSGKEWGNEDGEPWIALHGWLDNCGTFDTLLPLFPRTQRVICFDFPGHGWSSPYPKGSRFLHSPIGHRIGLDTFASNCSRCVYFILSPLLSFHLSDHLNIFLQNFCLFYIFLSPLYSPLL